MMKSNTFKQLNKESNDFTRHLRFRNVSIPSASAHKKLKPRFQHQTSTGAFVNKGIYMDYNATTIIGVYVKNLLLFLLPAFFIGHAPMMLIEFVSFMVEGEPLVNPSKVNYLAMVYGIALFFAYRRISDQMAYYNIHAVVGKHDLNQIVYQSAMKGANEANAEFAAMDAYRKRYNKYILFPSVKEMAVEEQLYQKAMKSKNENAHAYAAKRRAALSIANRENEHFAAKALADMRVAQNGGKNEYDELVRKYKRRAAPAIQDIIDNPFGF